MANYTQPDFRNPTPTPLPSVSNLTATADALKVTTTPTNYVEPGLSDKDDPHGTWRGQKKS